MLGGTGQPTAHGNTPQSLEQLLERQWEQGSQFLMEQAQHFDSKDIFSFISLILLDGNHFSNLNLTTYSCIAIIVFASIAFGEYPIRRACKQFDCTSRSFASCKRQIGHTTKSSVTSSEPEFG